MSTAYISAALRRQIRSRAGNRCEYCRLSEAAAYFRHEPDHIIAEKHGGKTTPENLALACFDGNRFKGSDIGSLDPLSEDLVPLFNPRTDSWSDHFALSGGRIVPLTAIGRATERLLRLNLVERVEVRTLLANAGHFP